MFQFAQGFFIFRRVGVLLLMLQLCLFVYGLPPFHLGIWLQTEPALVAMFGLGALNAVWLLYGVARGALVQQRSPVLFHVLLAWVAWQVLVTGFAFTPYRSWFGPVEMGEGACWHLSMVLLVMLAYPLWQVPRYRVVLLVWAACIISTEALLHVLFNKRDNGFVNFVNLGQRLTKNIKQIMEGLHESYVKFYNGKGFHS